MSETLGYHYHMSLDIVVLRLDNDIPKVEVEVKKEVIVTEVKTAVAV